MPTDPQPEPEPEPDEVDRPAIVKRMVNAGYGPYAKDLARAWDLEDVLAEAIDEYRRRTGWLPW